MNRVPLVPLITTVLAAALTCVCGKPVVTQTSSSYSCCDRKVEFPGKCNTTWSANQRTIGYSFYRSETNDYDRACVSPCERIEDGHMTLDTCVPVSGNTVCPDGQNTVEETITQYQAEPCPAPGEQGGSHNAHKSRLGSVGVTLLSVLLGALTVKLQTT